MRKITARSTVTGRLITGEFEPGSWGTYRLNLQRGAQVTLQRAHKKGFEKAGWMLTVAGRPTLSRRRFRTFQEAATFTVEEFGHRV